MRLLNPSHLWDFAAMKLRAVMRWFLALGIAVGVVIGPAAPLMASVPSAHPAIMTPAGDDDAMQMADDMPCCPKNQTPMRSDCDKCALSNCMIKLSSPGQVSAIFEVPVLIARIAPASEFVPAGLAQPPPERPPRTNI